MQHITSITEFKEKIVERASFPLFVKTDNCSVCDGLKPQVEAFEKDYTVPFYAANAAKLPGLAGKLLLFAAPVVLLFHEGKEIQRFARFVPLEELRGRLDELEEGLHV
ncbi:thioredoxin family protein [Planococcus sp. YIM B11945]|uniref:thioredoxin family protein n=1 Tax=Planococcus sp. YIM B11945 TaxID=3435410 RepID=UPI003D7E22D6